jgi:hypothetical protein
MNVRATHQTLEIDGSISPYAKAIFAVVFLGIGVFLWCAAKEVLWSAPGDELTAMYMGRFMAVVFFIIAVTWAPFSAYTYLDLANRQIVKVKYYACFVIANDRRPLTDFSTIVVRHLCHTGGEGEDTYTGSVGLKSADGRAVLWVKSFPATQDDVPRAAHEFAQYLHKRTGVAIASVRELNEEI